MRCRSAQNGADLEMATRAPTAMMASKSRIIHLLLLRHDLVECRQPLYKNVPVRAVEMRTIAL